MDARRATLDHAAQQRQVSAAVLAALTRAEARGTTPAHRVMRAPTPSGETR